MKQAQFHTLTTDHLGTVQMATNEAGEVTWRAQSEAFGKTTPDKQNQITMNLRFPGQYFDEETGTHYNYFRDYNPSIGRYIQRDPIGLEGGINTYAYVNGNPLKNSDTFGLKPSDVAALETAFLTGNIEAIKWLLTQGALNYRYEKLARLMLQNLALAQAATSSTNQNAWCQEEKNEHDDYHKMCDRKNPYKGQTCDWAKFELETALLCEQKRQHGWSGGIILIMPM